ncbi:ubiquinone/menaquinone biosynthesis C-methylase UbiE [Pedobacter sp. UYP30]|uniref:class I SAM-dependent methyltransferase n=1 Tax=Pedobacter sp. UYP30 TaxID=1756400 RepID=UPI003398CA49
MKDNFSMQSAEYALYRPNYPKALYDFLFDLVPSKDCAWDCATGNGQVARVLAQQFKMVQATDISENQLKKALELPNVSYRVAAAEEPIFENNQFDLITVGQAVHWFNFDAFYAQVNRTLKPNGVLAIFGYGLMTIDKALDAVIWKLYEQILGKYWDVERKYIEENYTSIPFIFEEIKTPELQITTTWTFDELIGYLNTWSALQHYKKANERNPIELILTELKEAWGDAAKKEVIFPVLLRVGKIGARD